MWLNLAGLVLASAERVPVRLSRRDDVVGGQEVLQGDRKLDDAVTLWGKPVPMRSQSEMHRLEIHVRMGRS